MPIAGSTNTAQIDLEVFGDDTVATLAVTDPDGATTHPTASAVDYGDPSLTNKSWRARVPYPVPGIYWHLWTVTGTGSGVQTLPVAVAPAGDGDDPRRAYATTRQLANALHAAPPLDADKKIKDASARIDDLTLCAIYDTDDDGMPLDAVIAKALMRATCKQVEWRMLIGDDDTARYYTSMSIAGVSMSRGNSGKSQTSTLPDIGPGVMEILAEAGLVGQGPWTLY